MHTHRAPYLLDTRDMVPAKTAPILKF